MSSPLLPPPGSPSSIPSPVSTLPPSDDSASADRARPDTRRRSGAARVVDDAARAGWPRGRADRRGGGPGSSSRRTRTHHLRNRTFHSTRGCRTGRSTPRWRSSTSGFRRCGRCRRSGSTPSGSTEIVVDPDASVRAHRPVHGQGPSPPTCERGPVDRRRHAGRGHGGGAGRPDDTCRSTSKRSGLRRAGRIRRDRHRLRTVRLRRRPGHVGDDPSELGGVHRRTRRPALHADGRTLTVSIPPVYDAGQTPESGYWVYDYGAIVEHVDRIRIMAYDYSVAEPGPIAPLDWVESTITGAIEATGSPRQAGPRASRLRTQLARRNVRRVSRDEVQGRTAVSARSGRRTDRAPSGAAGPCRRDR